MLLDMENKAGSDLTSTARKSAAVSPVFACRECGTRLSAKRAALALNSEDGCPGCGGSDIDLARVR